MVSIGLILPTEQTHMAGATPFWVDILAMAQRAEEVGFASVWMGDHLVLQNPGEPVHGVWECWSLLAALGASTRTIRIGPQVTSATFRHPALLARMADTVDEISAGRLLLGIGAGDHELEHRILGIPFEDRVSRAEEYIQVLTDLVRHGGTEFNGTYFQVRDCETPLRGPRAGNIPIIVAAERPRMMRIAARHADGWMIWDKSNQHARDLQLAFRAVCDAEERAHESVEQYRAGVVIRFAGGVGVPWATNSPLGGSSETIAEALIEIRDAGFGSILVWPDPNNLAGVEAMGRVLEFVGAA